MKKRHMILQPALAVLAILFWSYSALAIPIVSIQPSSSNPTVGSSFNVFVNISSVADLFAFQFDISFNRSIVSAVNVTEGSFLPTAGSTFFIPGVINNTLGTISFTSDSLIGNVAGAAGSGTLATLNFSALSQGNSPIVLSNVVLLDSALSDIAHSTVGGVVSPTGAVPESSSILLMISGIAVLVVCKKAFGRD